MRGQHQTRKRSHVSSTVRAHVLSKTLGRCAYCGVRLKDDWHADHAIPFARGGDDDESNLVPSCAPCNLRKSDRPLLSWLAADDSPVLRAFVQMAREIEDSEANAAHYKGLVLRMEDRLRSANMRELRAHDKATAERRALLGRINALSKLSDAQDCAGDTMTPDRTPTPPTLLVPEWAAPHVPSAVAGAVLISAFTFALMWVL